jgi:hypothetical protein
MFKGSKLSSALIIAFFGFCISQAILGCAPTTKSFIRDLPNMEGFSEVDLKLASGEPVREGYCVRGTSVVILMENPDKSTVKTLRRLESITAYSKASILSRGVFDPIADKIESDSIRKASEEEYETLSGENPMPPPNVEQKVLANIKYRLENDMKCKVSESGDINIAVLPLIYLTGNPQDTAFVLHLQLVIYDEKQSWDRYRYIDLYYYSEIHPTTVWSQNKWEKIQSCTDESVSETVSILISILRKTIETDRKSIADSRGLEAQLIYPGHLFVVNYPKTARKVVLPYSFPIRPQ